MTRDSSIKLSPGGELTAVEPSGPFLSVSKEGQWELDTTERVIKLDYARLARRYSLFDCWLAAVFLLGNSSRTLFLRPAWS